MSCVLSIVGEDLDIDDFVTKCNIKGFKKRYKGTLISPRKSVDKKLSYSYISIITSKSGFSDFDKQLNETLGFLQKNKIKLEIIKSTKEIQFATINFGVNLLIDNKNVLHQSNFFPNELIKICGELNIGIEITTYSEQIGSILKNKFS